MEYEIKIHTSNTSVLNYKYSDGFLEIPNSLSNSIDVIESTIEASSLDFVLNNKGNIIMEKFHNISNDKTKKVIGAKVEFLRDGHLMFVGTIKSYSNDVYGTEVTLETHDGISLLNTRLFGRELSNYVDQLGHTETVAQANNRLPTSFSCVERYIDDKDHNKGKKRVIVFNGTISHLISGIYSMVYSDAKITAGEKYDPNKWKEIYDEAAINTLSTGTASQQILVKFYYEWDEQLDNGLDFLTNYVFQPSGLYLLKNSEGKITFLRHNDPAKNVKELTEDKYYEVHSVEGDHSRNINFITSESEYSFKDDFNYRKDTYVSMDSFELSNTFLPSSPLTLNYKAVSKDNNSKAEIKAFVEKVKNIYFNKFNGIYSVNGVKKFSEVKTITIDIPFSTSYNVGQYIRFKNSKIKDFKDPTKDLSNGIVTQIINIEYNFSEDTASLVLLYTN